MIKSNLQADYFIRYDVKDSAGRIAASKHRILERYNFFTFDLMEQGFNPATARRLGLM